MRSRDHHTDVTAQMSDGKGKFGRTAMTVEQMDGQPVSGQCAGSEFGEVA